MTQAMRARMPASSWIAEVAWLLACAALLVSAFMPANMVASAKKIIGDTEAPDCVNRVECALLPRVLEALGGDSASEVRMRGHRDQEGGHRKKGRTEKRVLFVGTEPCPVLRSLRKRKIMCFAVEAFHSASAENGQGRGYCEPSDGRGLRGSQFESRRPRDMIHIAGLEERLPFRFNHFNVGYAGFVLEHLPLNRIPKALVEWRRVVRKTLAVAIRALEGESADVPNSGGKVLPPPVLKTKEWWVGQLEQAGFVLDKEAARRFERSAAGLSGPNSTTTSSSLPHHLRLDRGAVFFVRKSRGQRLAGAMRVGSRGGGARTLNSTTGYDDTMINFDSRMVSRTEGAARVDETMEARRRRRRARLRARREGGDHGGSEGGAEYTSERWASLSATPHRQESFERAAAARGVPSGEEAKASREDLQRTEARARDAGRVARLGEKEVGRAKGAARSRRRRGRRRGRRATRQDRRYDRARAEQRLREGERDALEGEAARMEAEIANAESEKVREFRARKGDSLDRAEKLRQEQARIAEEGKKAASQRHRRSLPVGVKEKTR